ncbi:unnamed protein product [Rangifer tarandus platyrhynchus]|uniref:Uncharacterized protein n=2 Tax=Rangifer tarandus platyrhynchus TaxID=3082113 RepID=A0ABN8YC91_RANTA|nr:unnamed protein product [Rangifer tarandus platyrhynchus]CAI9696158.1 unnamed protein product [Rangifer tarandus platyrhynchus]
MKRAAPGGAAGGGEDAGLQHASGAGRDAAGPGVTQRGAARLEEEEAVGSLTKHSAQHPARPQLRKRSQTGQGTPGTDGQRHLALLVLRILQPQSNATKPPGLAAHAWVVSMWQDTSCHPKQAHSQLSGGRWALGHTWAPPGRACWTLAFPAPARSPPVRSVLVGVHAHSRTWVTHSRVPQAR